ncbi:MAG TPA: hypothetical protein VJZ00_10160 [Thermoanaerobaculia bacterium]|nr:hypothetical protein [Thermoanaerobaculia bacterium]
MIDAEELLAIVRAMNDEGVQYIAFGAVALIVHGIVRNTEDADFFVARIGERADPRGHGPAALRHEASYCEA